MHKPSTKVGEGAFRLHRQQRALAHEQGGGEVFTAAAIAAAIAATVAAAAVAAAPITVGRRRIVA